MSNATQRHLTSEEKLFALRSGDPFRSWDSLDDQRVCALCGRTISGRQIEILPRHRGRPKLGCPTLDCSAGPHEWVHPGNPLTSDRARHDWSRIFHEEPEREPDTLGEYLEITQART